MGVQAVVVKAVPAQGCANCGEEYVASDITSQLLKAAEESSIVQVDIREYQAA